MKYLFKTLFEMPKQYSVLSVVFLFAAVITFILGKAANKRPSAANNTQISKLSKDTVVTAPAKLQENQIQNSGKSLIQTNENGDNNATIN